jgi:hypothetical protein
MNLKTMANTALLYKGSNPAGANYNYRLWAYSNGRFLSGLTIGGVERCGSTFFGYYNTNQWYNVVTTWDGSVLRGYINGSADLLNCSASGTATTYSNSNLILGGSAVDNTNYVNGFIDEVKIYNRALSATEIALDYNRGIFDSNYVSRIIDTNSGYGNTDYNYLVLNTNNGLDKNGHIYGTQIEPTIEKDLNTGLIGLWHLNSDVVDSSVMGNNGTPSNLTYTTGLWGSQAGSFNGSSSIATFSGFNLNGDASYTLSYWINPSQYKDDSCSICFGANGVSSGSICTPMCGGGTYVCVAHYGNDHQFAQTYKLNQWQHVVLAYDSSTSTEKMYYNGVFSESWTPADLALSSSRQLVFGRWQWASNPTNFFNGLLDEVSLWNRALDTNEVKELFNKGASRIGVKYRSCESSSSCTRSWSDLNYPSGSNQINLNPIDGNQFMQYSLYPTLYTFPDGNVMPQAFATIRDINLVYTN